MANFLDDGGANGAAGAAGQPVSQGALRRIKLAENKSELFLDGSARETATASARECVVTVDQQGRLTEFNSAAERTFGYRRSDVLGRNFIDVIFPLSARRRHRSAFTRFVEASETLVLGERLETTAVRADGSRFPVELTITRIPSETPPSFIAFLRDISEQKEWIEGRKWAETQLAGDKRLLEMIASGCPLRDVLNALCRFFEEAAPDCYCGVYPIDWSGPTFQYGVAPSLPATYTDPVRGLPVRGDIAPCGTAALEKTQVIAVDIESDPRWHSAPYRTHVLAHGLRAVWSTPILCSKVACVLGTFCIYQRKPGGPSPRVQALIAQVTYIASIAIERSRYETALKRSETLLSEGERLSLTGTFSWRVAADEIIWSEQVYRIFELERTAGVTLDLIRSRIHPDDIALFEEMVKHARASANGFSYEHRLQMPDGSVKYLHGVAHGTQDENGQLEYIGGIQDVTERRVAEEALGKVRAELSHATRAMTIGTLTASIAHEVNQPLSGIVTNASTCLRMLAADPPNIEGARETARRTIRDGNRAGDVIARLRALFSKKPAAIEPVNLNDAAREVIPLSSSDLATNRIVLRLELGTDIPLVAGDRVQLQQVILNLLRNASEAMACVDDRPRRLLVKTERHEGGVRLSVQDSGAGFKSEDAERLFDAFYTTKNEGMGIGLSVCRSVITSHQGRLWAALNDGPGATFSFLIPGLTEGTTSARSPDAGRALAGEAL